MWVMNQLKSHHIERLWVTPSSPSDPNPSLWAPPNELFIYYSEIRMRHVAGTEALWRIALHANRVLQSLSPTNQQFCSKLICIQHSRILPMCTVWKYEFNSSPVWCSWNWMKLSLNWSWILHASLFYISVKQNMLLFNGQCFDLADV